MNLLKKLFGRSEQTSPGDPDPGPAAPSAVEPADPTQITEISPEQLKARLDNSDELVLIDLRQAWEYHAGHIPGATHIFLQQIPMRTADLPKDKDIVLQCWHGFTSLDVASFLIQNGWPASHVSSLRGGMAGWVQAYGPDGLEKAG